MFIIMSQVITTSLFYAKPVSQVSRIGQSGGQAYDSDRTLGVRRDEICTRYNYFKNWPSIITWKQAQVMLSIHLLL